MKKLRNSNMIKRRKKAKSRNRWGDGKRSLNLICTDNTSFPNQALHR